MTAISYHSAKVYLWPSRFTRSCECAKAYARSHAHTHTNTHTAQMTYQLEVWFFQLGHCQVSLVLKTAMIYMFFMSGCKLLTRSVSYGWFVMQFADHSPCPQSPNSMNLVSGINDTLALLHFDIMYALYTLFSGLVSC